MCDIKDTKENGEKDPLPLKKRKKWRGWQKVLLSIGIGMLVMVIAFVVTVFVMRFNGRDGLKPEEQYITFKGKEYRYRESVINILCLGIDKAEPMAYMQDGRDCFGMSDAILLVSIDTKKHELHVISIPRDTMTDIQTTFEDGGLGQKIKRQLCYQYAYGRSVEQSNELTVDAVSKLLYNIQIQRVCSINFEALPKLNDAIGGVDVLIQEKDMDPSFPDNFTYGEEMHLEGELALRFVRARNSARVDGSAMRADRQKQYALAFAEKAKSVIIKNPFLPVEMFQELQKDKDMYTDIKAQDIIYLMPEVLRMSFSEEFMQTIPGESELGEDGYVGFYMDVDAVKELIINTFYEEI